MIVSLLAGQAVVGRGAMVLGGCEEAEGYIQGDSEGPS